MSEPSAGQDRAGLPPGLELSPAFRQSLLDPAVWQEGLEQYARATHVAVALVDADGRLLGPCLNPRPTWRLLRAQSPTGPGVCPFCVMPAQPGNCVSEAVTTGGLGVTRDRTGLVHVTVPLVLGGHALGALLAGQVFDQYPDQRMLEHIGVRFGLRPQQVWQLARLEAPVRRATLRVYADLLATLGRTFLQTRYNSAIEAGRLAEMTRLRDLLQQRTQELTEADRRKDASLAALAASEAQLRASLREKEVLLREVHHRVKNNLQVVASLLSLQSATAPHPAVHDFVQESERRIQAMALVHETLYQGPDVARLSLAAYVRTLSAHVVRAYGDEAARVAVHTRVDEVGLSLDAAMPCGLILSELLSNCLKHAFPDGQAGNVTVTLTREADRVRLTVRDDGCGVPEDLDLRQTDSLGLQLVCALTEQLQGTVALERDGGAAVTVTFPLPEGRTGGEAPAGAGCRRAPEETG